MKSIGDFIDFSHDKGGRKKCSLSTILDKNLIVTDWSIEDSNWKDKEGNKRNFIRIEFETDDFLGYLNTTNKDIMDEFKEIESKLLPDDEKSFTCCLKKPNDTYKFYPTGWTFAK